jgi:hypothetical protein
MLSGAIGSGSVVVVFELTLVADTVGAADTGTFSTADTTSEPLGRPLFSNAWRKMSSELDISPTCQQRYKSLGYNRQCIY